MVLSSDKPWSNSTCHSFPLRQVGGDRWNALFRFTVFLRSIPAGSDTTWVKTPAHRRKRELNWFQLNEQKLARLRRESESALRESTRNSRMARWVMQGEELRKQFSVPLTQPDLIELLSCTYRHSIVHHVTWIRIPHQQPINAHQPMVVYKMVGCDLLSDHKFDVWKVESRLDNSTWKYGG